MGYGFGLERRGEEADATPDQRFDGRVNGVRVTLTPSYVYNAFGQRTRKTKDNGDVFVYHYDRGGQLIAVTKNSKPKWDYLWADDQPIYHGVMHLNGSGVLSETERTFLITDHLNTPRLGLNENQTIVWRWDGDGFGETAADNDPDADGTKIWMGLRFPGQYADSESGLYYNWNRYYDPKTGRYVTSDPIGLDGGLNTYLYASANSLRWTDPKGLQASSEPGTPKVPQPPAGPGAQGSTDGSAYDPKNPNCESTCFSQEFKKCLIGAGVACGLGCSIFTTTGPGAVVCGVGCSCNGAYACYELSGLFCKGACNK